MAASIDDIVKAIEKGFARAEGASKSGKKTAGTGESGAPGSPKKKGKKDVASMEDELAVLQQYHAKLEGLGKTEIGRNARAQQMVLIAEQELKIAQAKLKEKNSMGIADAEALAAAQKKVDLAEENVEKLEAGTDKIREQTDMMRSFGKEAANTLLPFKKSKFFNVAAMGKFWDVMSSGAAATAAGLASFAVGILDNFIGGIMDAIFALDEMESSMMKATGMNRQMARQFADASDDVSHLWITTEEYGKAAVGLYGTMTDFTMLLPQTQNQLAATTSVLAKWGVSAQEVGKSFQFATKMMGRLPEQADQVALEMASFAMNVGVPVDQMMSDFNAMGPQIAKLGSEAPRAFKEMARVAKITGLEIGKLLNLTDKFDTFEGAAEMTGQLNAALGGNFVNAMDMMMETDPVGRFEQLRGALDDAGLTFDDMSYYQKNFYKDSLGLSDVGELAALMSGDMDLVSGATQESAQSMIDAKKRAHEMATMQENLNTMLANMIPVITPLIDLMKGFTELLAENADVAKYVGYAVAGLSGSVLAYKTAIKATAFIEAALMAPRKAMAGITRLLALAKGKEVLATNAGTAADTASIGPKLSAAGATRTAGAAAKASVPHILALGAAALMIGRAIGIAAVGVSELALAFKDLGVNAIGASVGIALLMVPFLALMALGYAMIAGPQAAVTAGVVGFFLALGAAAFLLGAGIGLAAYGMSFLVEAFAALDPVQILALSAAMIAFSAAMNMLAVAGVAAMFGAPGLIVLTAAIVGMAYGLSLIEELITNVANAFVSFFDTIANPNTASNIKEIAKAIEAIPIRKNIEFATSMAALAAANTAAGALGTTQAVTKAITGGNNQNNITSAATPYEVTINVMLDRDKLATVVEQINGQQAKKAIQGIQ